VGEAQHVGCVLPAAWSGIYSAPGRPQYSPLHHVQVGGLLLKRVCVEGGA
jgi:hypothetical protein